MATYKPIPTPTPRQLELFWSRVRVDMYDTDACWPWTGGVTTSAYGEVKLAGGMYAAHRVAFTLVRGSIPEGLTLDHTCRTRRCCNPDHLEPVTAAENTMRGEGVGAVNARKTHCPRGHELVKGAKGRICPVCQKLHDATKVLSPDRFKNRRARGLCVQCNTPSTKYRCDRCREIHNARGKGRAR